MLKVAVLYDVVGLLTAPPPPPPPPPILWYCPLNDHWLSFRHALHLVTAHLHRQNQVAHALRTTDIWLEKLSIHIFPYTFRTARTQVSHNLDYLITWVNEILEEKLYLHTGFIEHQVNAHTTVAHCEIHVHCRLCA